MYIETSVAIAITGIVVKGLDILYTFIKNKVSKDESEVKLEEILNKIIKLEDIIHKTDNEGQHLLYFPRRLVHQMDNNSELLSRLSFSGEVVAKTLDRITTTLELTVRVLDRLENKLAEKDR